MADHDWPTGLEHVSWELLWEELGRRITQQMARESLERLRTKKSNRGQRERRKR